MDGLDISYLIRFGAEKHQHPQMHIAKVLNAKTIAFIQNEAIYDSAQDNSQIFQDLLSVLSFNYYRCSVIRVCAESDHKFQGTDRTLQLSVSQEMIDGFKVEKHTLLSLLEILVAVGHLTG